MCVVSVGGCWCSLCVVCWYVLVCVQCGCGVCGCAVCMLCVGGVGVRNVLAVCVVCVCWCVVCVGVCEGSVCRSVWGVCVVVVRCMRGAASGSMCLV